MAGSRRQATVPCPAQVSKAKVRDMANVLLVWRRFWSATLWQTEPANRLAAWGQLALQVLVLASKDLLSKGALVRTSALAYASVLAVIPMLALLFAIFKGVGLQRLLAAHLLPQLAGGSQEFARQILSYVETTNVASLGVFGVVWLLVALLILMANVEQAFNHIWQISRARPWWRKLSDYLSIFLLFPILMAVAISLTTTFQTHPEVQKYFNKFLPEVLVSAHRLFISFGMVWLGMSFIYLVMPNTKVRFLSAFFGGLVGSSIWQGAQMLFRWFQGSAPYYNAIYGALYQILFLIIWMFWSWLIVLYGAEVAYVHQHLPKLRQRHGPQPFLEQEPLADEFLALIALLCVGARFQAGEPPLALSELAEVFHGQEGLAAQSVAALEQCGLIIPVANLSSDSSRRYLPKRPLEQMQVSQVLTCLRQHKRQKLTGCVNPDHSLARVVLQLCAQAPQTWQDLTLRQIVERGSSAGPGSAPTLPNPPEALRHLPG